MGRNLYIAMAFLAVSAVPPTVEAQSGTLDLDWKAFGVCELCELSLSPVVRLGASDDAGMIVGRATRVRADPRGGGFAVYEWGTDEAILLFDSRGGFRRAVGAAGDGPGEVRFLGQVAFDSRGNILAFDFQRSAILRFDSVGTFVHEVAFRDMRLGPARMLGDTMAVIGIHDRRPALVGYPLHLINVRSGEVISHFGASADGSWVMGHSFSDRILLGEQRLSDDGHVWIGHDERPRFEEWSIDGEHVGTIDGELAWYQPQGDGHHVPASTLAFVVDDQNYSWLLTRVLDARWQDVQPQGPEGAIPPHEFGRYFDARLDVFDLSERRHVGTRLWDWPDAVSLLERNGEAVVGTVEIDSAEEASVTLYSLEPNNLPKHR